MTKVYGTSITELAEIEKFFNDKLKENIQLCSSTKGPKLIYDREEAVFMVLDHAAFVSAHEGLLEAYMKWAELMNRE